MLNRVISKATGESPPNWCQPITWLGYAEKRYDRVKARLDNLLRQATHTENEGETPNGWKIEGNKIIVWEQRDAFGRRGFDWEDVPSTLIDEEASGANRTVLHRASLEAFLGRRLRPLRTGGRHGGRVKPDPLQQARTYYCLLHLERCVDSALFVDSLFIFLTESNGQTFPAWEQCVGPQNIWPHITPVRKVLTAIPMSFLWRLRSTPRNRQAPMTTVQASLSIKINARNVKMATVNSSSC